MTTAPAIQFYQLDGTPTDPPSIRDENSPQPPLPFFRVEVTREMVAEFYVQAEDATEAEDIVDELVPDINWDSRDYEVHSNVIRSAITEDEIPGAFDYWTRAGEDPSQGDWHHKPWVR